jgi:hypothetical protein
MSSLGVERTGWAYVNDAIVPQETFAPVVRNVGGKKYNSGRPDSVIQLTL